MQNGYGRFALVFVLGAVVAATAGCSATEMIPYPKLGVIKSVKERLLSKEEKDEEIRELTLKQKNHRIEAERKIEKR